MKKRLAASLLALLSITILLPSASLAAGKATATKEAFVVRPFLDYYAAEIYAEITNTGDKPVIFNGGLIELYDPDGNSIESSNIYSCYPPVLAPGESGYLYETVGVDEATEATFIDDYALTITGKGENTQTTLRVKSEGSFGLQKWGEYSEDFMVTAMVTNNSDELLRDMQVVFALFDKDGALLFVECVEPYYVGLPARQTIEVQTSVDSRIVDYWTENGIEPASIVTIAYVER